MSNSITELLARIENAIWGGQSDAMSPWRRRLMRLVRMGRGMVDAECARRSEGEARKACLIDLTRRRALDLR